MHCPHQHPPSAAPHNTFSTVLGSSADSGTRCRKMEPPSVPVCSHTMALCTGLCRNEQWEIHKERKCSKCVFTHSLGKWSHWTRRKRQERNRVSRMNYREKVKLSHRGRLCHTLIFCVHFLHKSVCVCVIYTDNSMKRCKLIKNICLLMKPQFRKAWFALCTCSCCLELPCRRWW